MYDPIIAQIPRRKTVLQLVQSMRSGIARRPWTVQKEQLQELRRSPRTPSKAQVKLSPPSRALHWVRHGAIQLYKEFLLSVENQTTTCGHEIVFDYQQCVIFWPEIFLKPSQSRHCRTLSCLDLWHSSTLHTVLSLNPLFLVFDSVFFAAFEAWSAIFKSMSEASCLWVEQLK